MAEYKEKGRLSRAQIATRLRRIADGVESGLMTAGEVQLTMPEEARFEMEVESDKLEIEIEWG